MRILNCAGLASLVTAPRTTGSSKKNSWQRCVQVARNRSMTAGSIRACEVKVLGLLDGLVDPETGEVLQDKQVRGLP